METWIYSVMLNFSICWIDSETSSEWHGNKFPPYSLQQPELLWKNVIARKSPIFVAIQPIFVMLNFSIYCVDSKTSSEWHGNKFPPYSLQQTDFKYNYSVFGLETSSRRQQVPFLKHTELLCKNVIARKSPIFVAIRPMSCWIYFSIYWQKKDPETSSGWQFFLLGNKFS